MTDTPVDHPDKGLVKFRRAEDIDHLPYFTGKPGNRISILPRRVYDNPYSLSTYAETIRRDAGLYRQLLEGNWLDDRSDDPVHPSRGPR